MHVYSDFYDLDKEDLLRGYRQFLRNLSDQLDYLEFEERFRNNLWEIPSQEDKPINNSTPNKLNKKSIQLINTTRIKFNYYLRSQFLIEKTHILRKQPKFNYNSA